MPLHLIKLAVGCESVRELKGWVAERMATAKKKGLPLRHNPHHADDAEARRRNPRGRFALLGDPRRNRGAGKIIAIEPFRDKDGIGRCRLVMQPKVIAVSPRADASVPGLALFYRGRSAARSRQVGGKKLRPPCRSRYGRELRDLGLL